VKLLWLRFYFSQSQRLAPHRGAVLFVLVFLPQYKKRVRVRAIQSKKVKKVYAEEHRKGTTKWQQKRTL
jgi:hypothetical protein